MRATPVQSDDIETSTTSLLRRHALERRHRKPPAVTLDVSRHSQPHSRDAPVDGKLHCHVRISAKPDKIGVTALRKNHSFQKPIA